jgi:hypothetical protein
MDTHDDISGSCGTGTTPAPRERGRRLRWLAMVIVGLLLLHIVFCVLFSHRVLSHPSWFIKMSSPVCPPSDMAYLLWPSIAVLLTVVLLVFRFVLKHSWLESAVRCVAAMAFGMLLHTDALFLLDRDIHNVPHLIGGSGPPFAGLGWQERGTEFIVWNVGIVAAWLVAIWILTFSWKNAFAKVRRIRALLICFFVYVALLLPYIFTPGHLAHGHIGLRVRMADRQAGVDLCVAMIKYARDHDDRLPRAKSTDELARLLAKEGYYTIGPHYWAINTSDPYRIHCPIQMARAATPEKFVFNTEYSGMALKEFRRRMDYYNKNGPAPAFPFRCPVHPRNDNAKWYIWSDLFLAVCKSDQGID